jgi:hypothetical protein
MLTSPRHATRIAPQAKHPCPAQATTPRQRPIWDNGTNYDIPTYLRRGWALKDRPARTAPAQP